MQLVKAGKAVGRSTLMYIEPLECHDHAIRGALLNWRQALFGWCSLSVIFTYGALVELKNKYLVCL